MYLSSPVGIKERKTIRQHVLRHWTTTLHVSWADSEAGVFHTRRSCVSAPHNGFFSTNAGTNLLPSPTSVSKKIGKKEST